MGRLSESDPDRVGVFGGTFDPPHLGHLILAETALDALNLSCVLFVLAADPPHKRDQQITPIQHRLPMLEAAIYENPRFALSRVDMDRPGPHYTEETLRLLTAQYAKADLFFLMGGDSLHDFLTWHNPAGILAQASLAVMRRPGAQVELSTLTRQLPSLAGRVVFVDAPQIGISATGLRGCVRAGHSIRYQVPKAVAAYIQAHQLYQEANLNAPQTDS